MKNLYIPLDNKTVVITGSSNVLITSTITNLAKFGAKIALVDNKVEETNRLEQDLIAQGFIVKSYKTNLLIKTEISKTKEKIIKDFGSCDILINASGGNNKETTTTFEYYLKGDIDNKDINSFFDIDGGIASNVIAANFLSMLNPIQVFAEDMIKSENPSSIINLSSINAICPLTKIPAYSASKSAIENFTKWLSVHFGKTNIRVNSIAPGFFITSANELSLLEEDGELTSKGTKIIMNTPMERFGVEEEIYGAIAFLASSELSGFINGITIPIDGGFSSYSGV
ncbi:MAG: SDR family oxidoreductase [Oscillospiraceae bacterium]|nr:SDR family oxidoreductase [Oscillospiraceae bacterium]